MPSHLVRFGTKQRRRFQCRNPETAATLTELGALIGRGGVEPNFGARILTRVGEGALTVKAARAAIKVAAKEGSRRDGPALTFADLGKAWTSGEIAARHPDHVKVKRTASKDAERLKVLNKTIGKIPVMVFTLADAELAMAALPKDLASATRRQYAQILGRLLALAVYPLKLIKASPLPRGFLPKVRRAKATAWLYPAEDTLLMACTKITIERRVFYGVLAREGLRAGEALRLCWKDLDLKRGTVRLDTNKTADPRVWALSEGVAGALKRFRPENAEPEDLVFNVLNAGRLAEAFRTDLEAAKIDRAELYERTKARQPIRLHDLRATFVTLALAAGKSEAWVSDRTGHRSSVMIANYRRAARTAAELELGELAQLDKAIVWRYEAPINAGQFGARLDQ